MHQGRGGYLGGTHPFKCYRKGLKEKPGGNQGGRAVLSSGSEVNELGQTRVL